MTRAKKQWWETLFDENYLRTYADIVTPERTARQISFLLKCLRLKRGAKILDLACGHGRHAIELARRGYNVTGLDYSKSFIALAKKEAKAQGVKVDFIRDDMRRLSFANRFDAILNLFTSFGYFDDEQENTLLLRKISRALKPAGRFFIDLNNTMCTWLRSAQKGRIDKKTGFLTNARKDKLSNGLSVTTKDTFDPATWRWSTARTWKEKGKLKGLRADVRVFSLPELKNMMEQNGLRVEKVWGGFQGQPFNFKAPRLIVLARKA